MNFRMRIETTSPYEMKTKYLDMEYNEMEAYVNEKKKKKWKTYGCTLMFNGWMRLTKLSIINLMVYLK